MPPRAARIAAADPGDPVSVLVRIAAGFVLAGDQYQPNQLRNGQALAARFC